MAAKRGPSYPLMSLPESIEKARLIYKYEPHNEMSTEAAAVHLGYKSVSGASAQMIANLRKFGLLEGRGDALRLSADALTILVDENAEDQTERREAIRRSALTDGLFEQISAKFSGIPAEATIVSHLVKQGYRQGAAKVAARNYRETVEFVEALDDSYNAPQPSKPETGSPKMGAHTANTKDVQLPLSADSWAVLRAPFPLDEQSWIQMMAVLNAMKPALVGARQPQPKIDSDDRE